MAKQGISKSDLKRLWGRAGNICAMPNCRVELSSDEGDGGNLGEMAHIKAEKAGGPRWDSALTDTQRNSYDNLILLCPTHHSEIDDNPTKWTVERLHQIKGEHEAWVAQLSRAPVTEFEGKVEVRAKGGDSAVGAKVTKPTKFTSGTSISVETTNVRKTVGLQIGEDSAEL